MWLLMADEADDMDDDAKEATDASLPTSFDTNKKPGKSQKQMHSGRANGNGTQDTEQKDTIQSAKVKKHKAVIDDSDDD